ncbi:MAG TPA: metallophosphoesterase, partial [Longimicrobium sp.]|nr:metallophosphoesterase [Longimicrobium sp.]
GRAAAAALVGAGALGAYAFLVEPRWLQVTRTKIHRRGLHPALEGFRVALLTDLHAGAGTPMSVVRRACRAAVAARPDLVALTGDFAADDAPGFGEVLDALGCLRAPYGVYAVPGNHDHIVGIDRWRRDVADQPAVVDLTNDARVLDIGGARLCVAGVDDYSLGDPSLEALPPPEARDFTLLLAHDPDQAERARRVCDAVDLIVSGHTHGGQVRLPFVGAVKNPAEREDLYEEGLRRRPWTQVYTSRGVGTVHVPARFLCRPEVALLELTGMPRPPRRG